MTPADQAFDCVAAEIALDVTAGLKDLRLHRAMWPGFACAADVAINSAAIPVMRARVLICRDAIRCSVRVRAGI
jgi:hypothetical protein